MLRRLAVLVVLAVTLLPGCAGRNGRTAGLALGALATFAGVVLTAQVLDHPTPCDDSMEGVEADPLCLGPVFEDTGRLMPPMLLASTGVVLLTASAIATFIHRNDRADEPRRYDRVRSEKLRYKLLNDAGRAPRPR